MGLELRRDSNQQLRSKWWYGRFLAIGRERQIKGWSRAKKLALVAGDSSELQRLAKRTP